MKFQQRYIKICCVSSSKNFKQSSYSTDFCLEIANITRDMAIKTKWSANYGTPCRKMKKINTIATSYCCHLLNQGDVC